MLLTDGQDHRKEIDISRFASDGEISEMLKRPTSVRLTDDGKVNELPGPEPPDSCRSVVSMKHPATKNWDNSLWVPHCRRLYTPILDHGYRSKTQGVVIHVNAGYFEGTIDWFRGGGSQGVGAHFEVGNHEEGVVQFLPLDRVAWHAVEANAFTIGIEHAGFGRRSEWEVDNLLELSAKRCSWILHRYGLGAPKLDHNIWPHSYGGEKWGGHFDCPGKEFPWTQYLEMVKFNYTHHWAR